MTTAQQTSEKEAAATHYSDMARVARLEAVNAELVVALRASEQCMADVLDIVQNGAGLIVQDEAYKSLKNDGLKLARAALAKAGVK